MSKKVIIALSYITIGVLTRTIWHIGPNIEFVTGTSLAAGYFFSKRKYSIQKDYLVAALIPLSIMAFTDWIIGNSIIFLFTWSAFLLIPLIGVVTKKLALNFKLRTSNKKRFSRLVTTLVFTEVAGISSTLLFFLWTNFGVVITTSMYPKTINGVVQSYINGLPFLQNQLVGNLIIVPSIFLATHIFLNYSPSFSLSTRPKLNRRPKRKAVQLDGQVAR